MADVKRRYEALPVHDLQRLLWSNRTSTGHVNQVWPKLYLGDAFTARDKAVLRELGITHIVNAAAGKYRINTGPEFYRDLNIDYLGVEADDHPYFDLSVHFFPVAQFIRVGLQAPNGKVLVHCVMGISRAASFALAFLMISEGLSLVDAIRAVSEHRNISPNPGFLEQLRQLDITLEAKRRGKVLVHCAMGISRAASFTLAFLMISEGLSLVDAIRTVSEHRDISPNPGFLEQLRQLDITLEAKRRGRRE